LEAAAQVSMISLCSMIQWKLFPKSLAVLGVVAIFEETASEIDSSAHQYESNDVLDRVRAGLERAGFRVENGKSQKVPMTVLDRNGRPVKSFNVDALNQAEGFVFEVEAGRGVENYQFLKDLFEACVLEGVEFLGIAVRNRYCGKKHFNSVCRFFETLYSSDRLVVPLRGILVVGY
jgi:hypothetical protein